MTTLETKSLDPMFFVVVCSSADLRISTGTVVRVKGDRRFRCFLFSVFGGVVPGIHALFSGVVLGVVRVIF